MLSSIKRFRRIPKVARCVGFENLIPRSSYLLQKKTGILKWKTRPLLFDLSNYRRSTCFGDVSTKAFWKSKKERFFPTVNQQALKEIVPETHWEKQVTSLCNSAIDGKYNFFSRWEGELDWPPNFKLDPVHNSTWSTAHHWTHVKCSASPPTDIKLVWEASRLSLAYYLSREFVYSENEKCAEYFWELIESWIDQNPVNQTIAWSCGQEVSFRTMAILWGLFATLDSPSTTPDRLDRVHFLIWQAGKRIAATTDYAISQENNHSLSEATVLWTIGLLFPEFKESDTWKKLGKKILAKEMARQVYPDGSYVQHSFNYHRVMLDDLMWAIRIGELNNERLPDLIYRKFSAATQWLGHFVDDQTGGVPNYGANDGANVLPLSCTDYSDYRPTLRAAEVIAGLKSEPTIDSKLNEKALWLTGKTPDELCKDRPNTWSAKNGGYHVLRSSQTRSMIRCGNYCDRPSHADMLHIDLWYRGINILRDSGSYRYHHSDTEVKNYFPSVKAHNTAQVKEFSQMTKGPSFLWLDWPSASYAIDSNDSEINFKGQAHIKTESVRYTHSRMIKQQARSLQVSDSIDSTKEFFIYWHLNGDFHWDQTTPGQWVGNTPDLRLTINIDGHQDAKFTKAPESLYYGETQDHWLLTLRTSQGVLNTHFQFD